MVLSKLKNQILENISHWQFDLRINLVKEGLFNVDKFQVVKQLNSSRNMLNPFPVVVMGDPFLFVHNGELYLFYEKQKFGINEEGKIKMRKTKDLKIWSKPMVVLKEDFHLSYPFVFQMENQIFMIPETHKDQSIRLYTPNEDLSRWKYYKTILKGNTFVDSSIISYKNKLYLFTTILENMRPKLLLYFAENLEEEWTMHPQSPINSDFNKSRCAGAVFQYQDKLYRPAQRHDFTYGDGVDIYQIKELSPTEYVEEKLINIIPNQDKFYSNGGHHFNYVYFRGKMIVATDRLIKRPSIYEPMRRIKKNILKLIR